MSISYTEASYENSLIELFSEMGYRHVYGPDIENLVKKNIKIEYKERT